MDNFAIHKKNILTFKKNYESILNTGGGLICLGFVSYHKQQGKRKAKK